MEREDVVLLCPILPRPAKATGLAASGMVLGVKDQLKTLHSAEEKVP